MKKLIILALLSISFANSVYSSEESLEAKIANLNAESVRTLGISLRELGYLAQLSGGTYMPLWAAERNGEIKLMRGLEEAGYLKVDVVQGLPDGTRNEITFVNAVLLPPGKKICDALQSDN